MAPTTMIVCCRNDKSIANTNFLSEKIKGVLLAPGITSAGSAWVAKALHPSDNVTGVQGLPTRDAVPSACVSYTCTYVVKPPLNLDPATTWDLLITSVVDPICFGKTYAMGVSGPSSPGYTYSSLAINNTQLGAVGATETLCFIDMVNKWSANTRLFRPTFAGVTTTLTAPTLADQGTVACAQVPLTYENLVCFRHNDTASTAMRPATATADLGASTVCPDDPTYRFEAIQGLPGAYTAEARGGTYMPIKLTQDAFEYRRADDTVQLLTIPYSIANYEKKVYGNRRTAELFSSYPVHPWVPDGVAVRRGFLNTTSACQAASKKHDSAAPDTTVDIFDGDYAGYTPSNGYMGLTYYKGLSPSATVTVTSRYGFELIVQQDSSWIPLVERAIPYDPVALDTYFRISRELADAYPASYNFLGTLWNVIKGIGSSLLPNVGRALGTLFSPSETPSTSVAMRPPPVITPTPQRTVYVNLPPPPQRRGAPQSQPRQSGKDLTTRSSRKGARRVSRRTDRNTRDRR